MQASVTTKGLQVIVILKSFASFYAQEYQVFDRAESTRFKVDSSASASESILHPNISQSPTGNPA
jgi:hypothetical protein